MIIKTQVSENVMFGQGRKKRKRGMKKGEKEKKYLASGVKCKIILS